MLALALIGCQGATQPNVLFIAVDDMNDYVNCLGGRDGVITPNTDGLAARGVLFRNAHTASPACHPSRVALLTGVRPATSGISQNVYTQPRASWRASPALKDAVTLPRHFRDNGYVAMGGGKIFHALQWASGTENEPESWDSYFPDPLDTIPHQILPPGYDPKLIRPEGRHGWFHWQALDEPDEKMSDHQVVDWAVGELGKRQEKPFFLAVGIFRPHMPWHVPRKYFDMYPLEGLKLPEIQEGDLDDTHGHDRRNWHQWVLENEQWPQALQSYLASTTFADAQIGRLVDALDVSAHAANTIVVLWSDHGMHIGEKENWEKFTLWEESTRVPLLFVAPGVTAAGGRSTRTVSLLDIYPTLAELCGLERPAQLEGTSLVPLLRDPAAERGEPAITTFRGNNHAVRTDRWRYIRYANGDEELYDHQRDPNEFTNLAGKPEHAELISELARWLPQGTAPNPNTDGFREF
ncbi:MAG: sulfatase [bacterium]|nr:sulfatase [bacterium]